MAQVRGLSGCTVGAQWGGGGLPGWRCHLAGGAQVEGWFGAQFSLTPSLQHPHISLKSWEEGVPSRCGCSHALQHLGALLGNTRAAAASSQLSAKLELSQAR